MIEIAGANVAKVPEVPPLDVERQARVRGTGINLVDSISHSMQPLVDGGIVAYRPVPGDANNGRYMYAPAKTDIPDGWHKVGDKGMRLHVLHPVDSKKDPSGYVRVELTKLQQVGGRLIAAGNPDWVRVEIGPGIPHGANVTGMRNGSRFNVNQPNERSMYADLGLAEGVLREAETGLGAILQGLPVAAQAQTPE